MKSQIAITVMAIVLSTISVQAENGPAENGPAENEVQQTQQVDECTQLIETYNAALPADDEETVDAAIQALESAAERCYVPDNFRTFCQKIADPSDWGVCSRR